MASKIPADPNQFKEEKGSNWNLTVVPGTDKHQKLEEGTIYSSSVHRLGWDKGRTSSIDGKVFWNFGDCLSIDGIDKGPHAGFSMGAAFYGNVSEPLKVEMGRIDCVTDHDFARPWTGQPNPDPVPPKDWFYGMDTTNTVQVGPGTGICFAWEIHRKPDGAYKDIGNAMLKVTLGPEKPVASRFGPLVTGPEKIQLGIMTIFNPNIRNTPYADGYIYIYCIGDGIWDSVIVGRAPVEGAFDLSTYQFMKTTGEWDAKGVIPQKGDTSYGMQGNPISNSQGSIIYNDYLGKYMLFCGTFATQASFYLSDTPVGPWSQNYPLLESPNAMRYGVNVHPDLLPQSNGKELLLSWGTNVVLTMYKLTFNY